jgi:hypothetical protein
MSSEIVSHLTLTNQIPIYQHWFLPRRSCNTLHMKITNDLQKLLDSTSGGHIRVISLD